MVLLGGTALLALIFGGSWAIDFTAASAVRLSVRISPSVLPADGQSTGSFVVHVAGPDGAPRVNDIIELTDEGPGVFDRTRALTDRHGDARFLYTTSLSSIYQPAGPVPVLVTDTSLGHLVEIDKMVTVPINTVDPSKLRKGS
jgi:hypothetical protein